MRFVASRRRLQKWRGRDEGSVTAELALTLPTLAIVLVIGIWLQSAVALRAQCLDAARAGARAAARGDADSTIRSQLSTTLPRGAAVAITHAGSQVTVSVETQVTAPGGIASLVGAPHVAATATGTVEATADSIPDPVAP
jgi:Flp pilus assembly protein TadG